MSSPLKWFRKHQKILLGVFGVLLMIVFTISFGSGVDPIVDSLTGAGGGRDPVFVSFKGGNLRHSDMESIRQGRYLLRELLMSIEMIAGQRDPQNFQRNVVPLPVALTNDESLLELAILNREAERLGVSVTDTAILSYLNQVSAGIVSSNEVLELWKKITRGDGSERQLLSLLRRELMAQKVRSMAQSGGYALSPIQQWDYFTRLERYVNAELLPIAVEDFIDEVRSPTEAELLALYAEFKNKYPEPNSADPGFKRRLRRSFDYVKFDQRDFLRLEMEKITEDQVVAYYEQNKEDFRETLPASDLELDDDDGQAATDESADFVPSDDDNSGSGSGAELAPSTPSADTQPTEESEDAPGDSLDSDPSYTPLPQDPSGVDEPGESDPDPSAASNVTAPQPPEGEAAKPNETLTEAPSKEIPAEMTDDAADTEASDANVEATAEATAEEPRYRPLDEVRESIKEKLAAPEAQKKMREVISRIQSQMDRYYRNFAMWQMRPGSDKGPQPELPDIGAVESAVPVAVASMPLADELEAESFELGQAYELDFVQQSIQQIPFAEMAFGNNMSIYHPVVFPMGEAPTKFVYWITGEEAAHTPEFATIREEVARTWRLREARNLARAAAEDYAEKARQSDAPLSETLAATGRNFYNTGEITWMTTGNIGFASGALPQPSEIPGVPQAGEDFRQTLFRLAAGEVGVAFDDPMSTVFVIRVMATAPSEEELADQFLNDSSHATALGYMVRVDGRNLLFKWYQDLLKSYDVNWRIDPEASDRRM